LADNTRLGLKARYGGCALVTGAARGIGRAFAQLLAAEGFDLLLVDREEAETKALADELHGTYGIEATAQISDLAKPDLENEARSWAQRYEIGLLVNNAGISLLDPFFEISLDDHLSTLDLNCRATLVLTHIIGQRMRDRGRGGIIVVSSASALSGSPYFCHYAATKAYGLNLAAGLWSELRGSGVDALAVCPGMTDTKPVQDQKLDQNLPFYIPLSDPKSVALAALGALGRQPALVPTWTDRVSTGLLSKLLPRRWTLSIIKRSIEKMRG
jgi:short-subunit dehydrogenase